MSSVDQTLVSDLQMSSISKDHDKEVFNCIDADDTSNGILSPSGPVKVFYTYDDVHILIEQSAQKIREVNPDYIIAIGGGGLIPGRMVRHVVDVPVFVVTVNFYDENDQINPEPIIVQWLSNPKQLRGKKCLIVDEVNDSGSALRYVIERLINEDGVTDLSAIVLHHKEKDNLDKTDINNFLCEKLSHYIPLVVLGDIWIVYPWETDDIVEHNKLAQDKPAYLQIRQFPASTQCNK